MTTSKIAATLRAAADEIEARPVTRDELELLQKLFEDAVTLAWILLHKLGGSTLITDDEWDQVPPDRHLVETTEHRGYVTISASEAHQ